MRRSRTWMLFIGISVALLGADLAYLNWRERSLEPLSEPIDLSRSGTYSFSASGFHASPYYPAFNLQLPFETDVYNWFKDDGYSQLWGDSPPRVEITVHDQAGNVVLRETSSLTSSQGWIVTGSPPDPWVEVYKLSGFDARMFGAYRVRLTVLQGSPAAAGYQPLFEIAAIRAYATLPAFLGFVLLAVTLAITALVIATVQIWRARRRRSPTAAHRKR